ncbi:22319_t:CDS:1, partial [Cetraspora pellucida]
MIDINKCSRTIVAKIIKKTCEENNLDLKQCQFWLTDNMTYMLKNKSDTIVEFN